MNCRWPSSTRPSAAGAGCWPSGGSSSEWPASLPGYLRPVQAADQRILTTLRTDSDTAWTAATTAVDPPHRSLARWVVSFGLRARRAEAVIVRGTSGSAERYRDLLAAVAVRVLAPRTRVVVSDATIEPRSRAFGERGLRGRAGAIGARTVIHLIDSPRVTWCVLSRAEVERFPRTWGLTRGRVVFTPFPTTLPAEGSQLDGPPGDHLFSGGNSLRDYELLRQAAAGLDVRVVVATSSWRPQQSQPGLEVAATSHEQFVRLMATSRAVVLCLAPAARSTGQQTYLNAMALGRPTLVTDSDGVRDHIEDGVTGVVMPATVEGVRAAIRDLLDPARGEHYAAMGKRAREVVSRDYSSDGYRRRLVEVARGNQVPSVSQAG